jgi:hypothetical protein
MRHVRRRQLLGNLSFANSAQMMWTLAFKDEIADTKDNLYTLEGIRHVGQQTSSFGQDSEGDNQSPVYVCRGVP